MQNAVESDLVYFLHIPKTSGSKASTTRSCMRSVRKRPPPLPRGRSRHGTYQLSERTRIISASSWHSSAVVEAPGSRRLPPPPCAPCRISITSSGKGHRAPPPRRRGHGGPVLRPPGSKTVDNFQSRYLATLDFTLALMPTPSDARSTSASGRIAIRFNALYSLEKRVDAADAVLGIDVDRQRTRRAQPGRPSRSRRCRTTE